MELESVVKLIGCFVVSVFIFAIPCLTTLAFALNWDVFFKYLFTGISTCAIITMAAALYGEID